jgi:hypothetical protein
VVAGLRGWILCVLSVIVWTLADANLAPAAHWSMFGGSAGRSSYAFGEPAGLPLTPAWRATGEWDAGVWTSPVVTQGARALVAYGSQKPEWVAGPISKGNVHVRDLVSGQPVTPPGGINVDDGAGDADTFGGGNKASVAFADSSAPGGPPGQLFVVHNDDAAGADSDVAIAQIDEATGQLVQDVPVPRTPHFAPGGATVSGQNGSDVSGSPALQLDADGNGVLVFRVGLPVYDNIATITRKIENVHVVPLHNARSPAAVIDTAHQQITPDFQPTSRTSPTLITLADPTNAGQPTTYIAMGTSEPGTHHYVKTFRLNDLAPGPTSDPLTGWAQTIAIPLTPTGQPAGTPTSGLPTTPYLIVATAANGATRVYKLEPRGKRLAVIPSRTVDGYPSPALAINALAGADGSAPGRIAVTTEKNLYVLDAGVLRVVASLSHVPLRRSCAPCDAGETSPRGADVGFYATTPIIAGNTVYVARDDGTQLVLDLETAQPVPATQFTQDAANLGSVFARGQPAVANGYAVFAGSNGVFAYRVGAPPPDPLPPTTPAGARGPVVGRATGPLAYLRLPARARLRTVRRRGLVVALALAPWTRPGVRVVRGRLFIVRKAHHRRLIATVRRTARRPTAMHVQLFGAALRRRLRPARYLLEVTVGDGRHQFGPPLRRQLTIIR